MSITKVTLAKESNTGIEYLYPKTTSDIVEYNGITVKAKLDSLDAGVTNINNILEDVNNIPGVLQIEHGGTGADNANTALYNLSFHNINVANQDLDSYHGKDKQGYYYFDTSYLPNNAPYNTARGYLIVLQGGDQQCKQIWMNQGDTNIKQNNIYVRTYDNYKWSEWEHIERRIALVGNDINGAAVGWHKVASGTLSGNDNASIIFAVHDTRRYFSGLLSMDIRSIKYNNNTAEAIITDSFLNALNLPDTDTRKAQWEEQKSCLKWIICSGISDVYSDTVNFGHFKIHISGMNWALYCKVRQVYYRTVFEVIEESGPNKHNAIYTLYSNQKALTSDLPESECIISQKPDVESFHPTYTTKDLGLYKIKIDKFGHVSETGAVTESDFRMKTLTIKGNGTSLGTYNGSADKTINITASSIGAAADHTHKTLTIQKSDGTSLGTYNTSADKTIKINITAADVGAATSSHTHDEVSASAKGFMSTSQFINVRDNLPNGRASGSYVGTRSSAIGKDNTASGSYSIAIGEDNTASGSDSYAIGQSNTASNSGSIAIGKSNNVSGSNSVNLGHTNTSKDAYSYALGSTNTINTGCSTAIGTNNIISGAYSTALGEKNTTRGRETYAFGSGNVSSNEDIAGSSGSDVHYSCAIGCWNKAKGYVAMAIGRTNTASGDNSYAIGQYNTASGDGSYAIGRYSQATGTKSFAIGGGVNWTSGQTWNTASGERSMAIGIDNTASGSDSYAIGRGNNPSKSNSYAIGQGNTASGDSSYAIGRWSKAKASSSLAIGSGANWESGELEYNEANGGKSVAIGIVNHANAYKSFAFGYKCTVDSQESIALGCDSTTSGGIANVAICGGTASALKEEVKIWRYDNTLDSNKADIGGRSLAIGLFSKAMAGSSVAIGTGAVSKSIGQFTCGFAPKYENFNSNGSSYYDNTSGTVFAIGNGYYTKSYGSGDDKTCVTLDRDGTSIYHYMHSNIVRIENNGTNGGICYLNANIQNTGADYAEFIKEWWDGNPDNEDRVGYMVTIGEDNKLHKANEGDYIIGITSGNPSVVGNGDEDYYWMYERDRFNRIVTKSEIVTEPKVDDDGNQVLDDNGDPIYEEKEILVKKLSSSYDKTKKYICRSNRPEWDYVGMRGIVPCRDDGTCIPRGFCKCGSDGIATKANTRGFDTYYVVERIDDETISVEVK